jgi:hypothetical protein
VVEGEALTRLSAGRITFEDIATHKHEVARDDGVR